MLRFVIYLLFFLQIHSIRLGSFQVSYAGISGLLFSDFTSLAFFDSTAIVGDSEGYLNVFTYDEKKGSISFNNTNRPITPTLSYSNQIIKIQFLNKQSVIYLNSKGRLCFGLLTNNFHISSVGQIALQQQLSTFHIINTTHFVGISYDKMKLCLYRSEDLIQHPQQNVVEIFCNVSAKDKYENVDVQEQIVATGSSNSIKVFRILTKGSLEFVLEIFLLKSEEETLALKWVDGQTLLSDNGLWLSSIVFDSNGTAGKVLSSLRIQKTQTKGYSDKITITNISKNLKQILVNGYDKGLLYEINNQSKITFKNESNDIGKIYNQQLISPNMFISTQKRELQSVNIDNSQAFAFKILGSASVQSSNHYSPVQSIASFNDILVSVSDGGQNNFKIWKITSNNMLELTDQKSFTYFSILKSGYSSFETVLMIPPEQMSKSAKNQTTHVLIAGSQPFQLILIIFSATAQISEIVRSTAEHSANITCLFRAKQFVFSGSKDTTIVTWTLSNDRKSLNKTMVTSSRKGPINGGAMDSSQQYLVFTHDTTFNSKISNITLWRIDVKTGKLTKIAENYPTEAHLSNITAILFTKDERCFVTYSAATGELKLWQHLKWTIVDLLASLSLGVPNMLMTLSSNGTLVLESQKNFYFYSIQPDSFVFLAKTQKEYSTIPTSIITFNQETFFQGANDGAIRTWKYSQ